MRRLAALAAAALFVSACSSKVDPTNPWDADTPGPQQAKARISGVVKLGGVPAALVQVRLRQNGATVNQQITLADGSFVFSELVPGAYVVETERTGFQKYAYPVSLGAGQAAALEADLTALAGAQTGTLKGTALLQDQATHGGILVEVHVAGSEEFAGYTAITSTAGEYQIPVAEGTYDLRFIRSDFTSQVQANVTASAGALTSVPEVVLAINPARVSGTVVGETLAGSLAPLDQATITLQGAGSNQSAANGSWGFNNVIAGSYLLRATKAGYLEDSVPVIGLEGGEDRVLADPLVLRLARGQITGTVQLADSADASGAVVEATGTGVATVTGASGAFTLAGLVEGVYEVSIRKDGYAPAIRAGITVSAASSASVGTVTLARQGGAIDIVEGAVTRNRTITVRLNATTASGYRISQDPTFTSAALGDTLTVPATPRAYAGQGSTHPFTLDDLDGRHEVYVIFYDGATASSPASASIVLDRTPPANPSVVIEDGSGFTKSTVVGLALSAQDLPPAANIEVSGLATMELADNAGFSGASAFGFAVSSTWAIGAGDGAKQVWVRFTDKAGNVSDPASATIVLDTTPPSAVAVALSGGVGVPAGFAGSPLVSAALAASDANAGTGGENLQVKLSNSSGLGGSTFQPFSATVPWFVSAGDGLKTVYVQVMDPAGNLSVVANGTINLLATPPSSGSLVVEGGAEATNKTTLSAAVSATGAAEMRLFVNGAAATGWIPYATSASVPLGAAADGSTASVSVSFRNAALVEGGSASTSILLDRTPPTSPSIAVAGGAAFAASTAVTLALSATDAASSGTPSGLSRVQLSNDAGFATSTTVAYGTSVPWTLAAGADGVRTVYARFLDAAGNASAAVNDAITVDTTAPSATSITLAGNAEAPAGFTGTPIVTATLAATDANGGAGNANLEVRLANDLGFSASTWQPYAASMAWVLTPGDNAKTVYAQFRDPAGNVSSPPASANITLASTAPTNGAILVEGGAAATNKSATPLAVALSATGATQMRLFVNGAAATGWIPYATATTLAAASLPDEAVAVISVAFRNAGGLEGANASTSILVDRRAPTSPAVAVNGGATYAASGAVVLTLSANDAPAAAGTAAGVDRVQLSNDGFTTTTTVPYATSVAWTLAGGADGARTVSARFLDRAGNVSAVASDGISLDTAAPASPTIALAGNPEAPAGFTGTPVVTATLSATDANGGAGNANLEVRLSNDLGFSASTWQPFAASMAWVLTPGDNAKTVYAQFRDPAGNVSTTASAGITLASTSPSAGSIVVENGAATTNKSATPLAVTVAAANATQMRLSVNGAAATAWIPYATSTTLPAAGLADEATAVISVTFRNAGGLEGGTASTSILVDRRAPASPSISVAAGAAYAGSTAVTLTLSASDAPVAASGVSSGLDRIQLSNDNFATTTTVPYAASVAWTLPAGADGTRTVYARFLDRAGNVSGAVNDPITLDTTAPAAGTLALTGNPEATAGNTGTPVVTAALTTSDANGGAGNANLEVQLSNSSGFAGATWQVFTSSLAWVLLPGDGAKTVYARFRDPAGNVSSFIQANITLAATAPSSGSIALEGGAAATNKSATPLSVALGATGATQMRLFVNGTAATGWIAYAASTTLAASGLADEAVASVSVLFRNAGGVEGAGASTSILVDRRAPTSGAVVVAAGAAYAGSTSVTLAVSAVDAPLATGTASGLASVQVSNDGFATAPTTFPMADTVPWTLAAGADGVRTVSVRFVDRAGNVSSPVSDPITLDTTAPAAGTIALTGNPEATAGNTGTPIVSAALTTSDTNGGSGNVNLEVQLSNSSGFAGATWQPFAASIAWVLTPGDGAKTVYARFRDPAGNVSTFVQANITLAATPPSSGTMVLASGAAATATQTIAVALTASGATQMRFFVNGAADARGWITYAASTTVDLGATPNEANRVVSVSFRNVGGVEGGGTSASIRFDTAAPNQGTLAITGTLGNGSLSSTLTATPAVVLSTLPFTANTDVTQMAVVQASGPAVACSTQFASPSWQPAANSLTFVLTGADGAKRVCLLFRDAAGNFLVANAAAANITLDTTPPTNPTFVNVTSRTQNAPLAPTVGSPSITAATDTNGVTYQCVGGTGTTYGAQWRDCGAATTLPSAWTLVRNSENQLGVRARDAAYNYSPGSFVRIVHDDVAPTPPFIVELRSSRDSVTVIWDATADTDVVDYLVYYGNAPGDLAGTGAAQGSSPIASAAPFGQAAASFTLTGLTQGIPYYVAVEAVDAAGNRSGPSGERSAVPNRANPRMISTISPTPRALGYRTSPAVSPTKTFVYVGTNQGITQLDATDAVFAYTVGRAFLPDVVPVERAALAVFDCTKGAVPGHCVVPSGTTLEGDFRNDADYYRGAAPIVFFPLTGTSTNPVVGTIESILPTRPTHVVPYTSGGVTYLSAVDLDGVRVFTVDPANPSLVRQVTSIDHAAPVISVEAAGMNGSELYVIGRVDSRYFGGPTDAPLVFGYDLSDVPGGDSIYEAFNERLLVDGSGQLLGDRLGVGGDQDAVFLVDGGIFAAYHTSSSNVVVSSYNPYQASPGVLTPVSTATVIATDGEATHAAYGGNQLYVWAEDADFGDRTLRQVNVSGFTLTAAGSLSNPPEPLHALVARTHVPSTRIYTVELSSFDPQVRHVRRYAVSGATVSSDGGIYEQIRPENFAWADQILYVSQQSSIYSVDVSNPYVPRQVIAFQPLAANRYFGKLLVHGRFLYAASAPGVQAGGVAIFRLNNAGFTSSTVPLRTLSISAGRSVVDLAVSGRWLFAVDNQGDLWVWNLAPTTNVNNPANSTPLQIGGSPFLAASFQRITARRDTSTTAYDAVLYLTSGDLLLTYGWNGTALTLTALNGAGTTFASSQNATSIDVAGNYAAIGTPSGTYLMGVSSPASTFVSGAAVYPVAGPSRLQSGYVVGLAASNDPSGPAFLGRGTAAVDGSIRFSGCTGGADRSLAYDDGLYAASCGKNGIGLFTPGALEGMRLIKSYDVSPSWVGGAAFATDGMIGWLGGPNVWTGSANDASRLYLLNEEGTAEGSNLAPSWVTNLSGAETTRGSRFMVQADGVLYVLNYYLSNAYLDAYEATTPYSFISRLTLGGTETPTAMVTDGEYAYVSRGTTNTYIQAVDLRNPASMAVRATSATVANKVVTSLAISRDRLYASIAQGSIQWNDINVWDLSSVQSAGSIPALTTISLGAEGGVTGVAVTGTTILWTVHDPIYRAPLHGLGIGTLGGVNRDGSGFVPRPGGLIGVSEPLQSPVIAGDQLYLAANLGIQAWDLRGWWNGGNAPIQGGGVSLADPLRLNAPVKLHLEGPFAYLTGGIFRSFDLR